MGISGILVAIFASIFVLINFKRLRGKKPSYDDMFFALCVADAKETFEKLYASLPSDFVIASEYPFIITKDSYVIYYNIKFLPTSKDDIAKAYRFCLNAGGLSHVKILATSSGKAPMETATRLGMRIEFVSKKRIRDYFIKHNLVPIVTKLNATKLLHFDGVKDALYFITEPAKTKYYLLSAGIMVLSAFFTMYTVYYLIISGVMLIMCAVCLIRRVKNND